MTVRPSQHRRGNVAPVAVGCFRLAKWRGSPVGDGPGVVSDATSGQGTAPPPGKTPSLFVEAQLNPLIRGAAVLGAVVGDGLRDAIALGRQHLRIHSAQDQVLHH